MSLNRATVAAGRLFPRGNGWTYTIRVMGTPLQSKGTFASYEMARRAMQNAIQNLETTFSGFVARTTDVIL